MTDTLESQITEVDWARAWLAPVRGVGHELACQLARGMSVGEALNTADCRAHAQAIEFVHQRALPAGQAYEQFIHDTRQVPTRDNLHDFFNGLIWRHYPLTKRRLNQLQAFALAEQGVGPVRGPLRDACTLFDESGAVLQAPEALWQALLQRDWQALFVTHRALWAKASLRVFGHALLEQLVQPRKGITAHVLVLPVPSTLPGVPAQPGPFEAHDHAANMDAWLSAALDAEWMRTKPFTPLPLLGVPGWCSENADPGFYDDRTVFRPRRPTKSS